MAFCFLKYLEIYRQFIKNNEKIDRENEKFSKINYFDGLDFIVEALDAVSGDIIHVFVQKRNFVGVVRCLSVPVFENSNHSSWVDDLV